MADVLNIPNLFDVRGRVALVTGGSSGIGLMVAKSLVQNGVKVYITALPSDPIQETVQNLNEIGKSSRGSAEGFSSDVSSKDSIADIAEYIKSRETHLDILISNAGVRHDPPKPCNPLTASLEELQASLWSSSHTDWDATFRINTTAHYFLSVALLPLLVAAAEFDLPVGLKGKDVGRGVIVITSSCASMHNCTNIDLTSYAASKAATDHLVALLASKFARWYVRVNSINPGFVPSNMNPIGAEGNMFAALFDKVPAKRAGKAEDIAGTVLYLCSQAGAYVDGRCLCVDGGRVLLANGQE
ncbi:short-chain dehydrogenase [Mytilinidion resinicola]|uniref:Short-chain dehydrogenase n=1 Tax=Mytilinidion resinicola TaxID=574789 RepID=A0A6A6YKF7_9PEZI|nr:short-chain dehydrogenase [Mytilinidion resinicola]KAF2808445.1 short-chain dehydrogenase [Mytilinidion resinicola]